MSKENNNKIRTITARVTQDERDALTRRAAGRSLSDYIRKQVLDKRSRAPLQLVEREALAQLNKIADVVGDYIQHVATYETLKRGEILVFLRAMENDLHGVRLAILKGGSDDGDC